MTVSMDPWASHRDANSRRVSRREFVLGVGRTATGLWVAGAAVACGGGDDGVSAEPTGDISGRVLDVQGVPQPRFGVLILMYDNGRHVGLTAVPDDAGRFSFPPLAPAEYQIRFQAAGQAIVPEPYQHPLRFAVSAGRTTDVTVRVQRGNFPETQVEIYCGDGFYQRQPDGRENDETVVRLGAIVCWYNVGLDVHTVTGGPWNDSGDLQKTQSYIWVANVPGLHAYRCRHTQPQMQATLRVVP